MTVDTSGAWPFVCSVCGAPLFAWQRVMRCDRGHSFDVARQGYVNLLTGADAERGIAGDTRAMLHARRRFLDAGHFDALLGALKAEVRKALSPREQPGESAACVLEVGCGEGFYIGNMGESTAIAPTDAVGSASMDSPAAAIHYVGLDVSKEAVRLASGRYRSAQFAVANARRRLYVGTGSVNVLLSIFAPRNEPEFRRVLADDGALIVAIPRPGHMEHVRNAYGLLDMEAAKEERVLEQFAERFALAARRVVEYPLVLSPAEVRDYIAMGPNARHTNVEEIKVDGEISTLASFVVLRFGRRAHGGFRAVQSRSSYERREADLLR